MTKSLKAVLLSAFVYPGAGQMYLKHYPMGIILISITSVALYFVISHILSTITQILEQIQSGQVQPDLVSLLSVVTSQTDQNQLVSTASTAIVITWIMSIIHAYLLGKSLPNNAQKS